MFYFWSKINYRQISSFQNPKLFPSSTMQAFKQVKYTDISVLVSAFFQQQKTSSK